MNITVYSSQSCHYCKSQKEYLYERNVEFKEINIHESPSYFNEFKRLGGIGVPLTVIERGELIEIIHGFNVEGLEEKLDL